MTQAPQVTVAINSWGRTPLLRRLLRSFEDQCHPSFELVIVGEETLKDDVSDLPMGAQARFFVIDEPNLSKSRNIALKHAAGKIIAFCDDDAVPEPRWLRRLTEIFTDKELGKNVGAAAGFVRGRNGISFQWRASEVDHLGRDQQLAIRRSKKPTILPPRPGWAVKTVGTNCAFRTQLLRRLGGFDENFKFYLEETDLNFRISARGWHTAIVPMAEVHHGYAASHLRRANRAPKSLFEVGASKVLYCRKHAAIEEIEPELAIFAAGQRKRLLGMMDNGLIEPGQVGRLLGTLAEGFAQGWQRSVEARKPIRKGAQPNATYLHSQVRKPQIALCGTYFKRKLFEQEAHIFRQAGACPTILDISFDARFLQVAYSEDGIWRHQGGVFGKVERKEKLFLWRSAEQYFGNELARIAKQREFDVVIRDRLAFIKNDRNISGEFKDLLISRGFKQVHAN